MQDFLPYLLGPLTDSQLSDLGYSKREMFVSCVYNKQECTEYVNDVTVHLTNGGSECNQ